MSVIDLQTAYSGSSVRRITASVPRIGTMLSVARERRALMGLSDSRLADLGLTREDAAREAVRPIWDVPLGR